MEHQKLYSLTRVLMHMSDEELTVFDCLLIIRQVSLSAASIAAAEHTESLPEGLKSPQSLWDAVVENANPVNRQLIPTIIRGMCQIQQRFPRFRELLDELREKEIPDEKT